MPLSTLGTSIDSTARAAAGAAQETADAAVTATVETNVELPVYDGNQNTIHIDVLYSPTPIHGYFYWAAYTPYPSSSRELPSIAASQDGANWVIPVGAPNPLVASASSLAGSFDVIGDTDIVLLPSGDLAVYFIATCNTPGNERNAVWRSTSADGITWAAPVNLFEETVGGGASIGSPAVVVEADDSMSMYYTHYTGAARQVIRRTSAIGDDGATWAGRTVLTTPVSPGPGDDDWYPWHLDVHRTGSTYTMLMTASYYTTTVSRNASHFLQFWSSANGTTFTGSVADCLPDMGDNLVQSVYRSSLMPSPTDAARWDLWVVGLAGGTTIENADAYRVHRFRDMRMDGTDVPAITTAPSTAAAKRRFQRLAVVLDQDVSIASNTTIASIPLTSAAANPDGLSYMGCKLAANQSVTVKFIAWLTDANSSDNYKFQWAWTGTGSFTGIWTGEIRKISGSTRLGYTLAAGSSLGTETLVGNGAEHLIEITGHFTAPAYAGTLRLMAAQGTSRVSAIVIKKGASLEVNAALAY